MDFAAADWPSSTRGFAPGNLQIKSIDDQIAAIDRESFIAKLSPRLCIS